MRAAARSAIRSSTKVAVLALLAALAPLVAQEPTTTIKVDVQLVRLAVSATAHGMPVKALTRDDFSIREEGAPQPIQSFWQEGDLPLTIGLIVDVSGSQMSLLHQHRETLLRFLKQVMQPRDRAMIVTVGPQARLLTDLTDSQEELARGIDQVQGGGRRGELLGEPCHGRAPAPTVADEKDGDRRSRRRNRMSNL